MENLINAEENKPEFLYKYITFEQFVSLIETGKSYLTNITIWEDCYEGYALEELHRYSFDRTMKKNFDIKDTDEKGLVKLPLKLQQMTEIMKKLSFGQSWTKSPDESDAMWRIYSTQKTGVRIKVSRKNIFKQVKLLESSSEVFYNLDDREVEYDKPIDYELYMKKENENQDDTGILFLFHKRKAFKHEEEYRIAMRYNIFKTKEFMRDWSSTDEALKALLDFEFPKVFRYDLPNEMIEEVILDPRAPQYFEEAFEEYCKYRGFVDKNIKFRKSDLYTKK